MKNMQGRVFKYNGVSYVWFSSEAAEKNDDWDAINSGDSRRYIGIVFNNAKENVRTYMDSRNEIKILQNIDYVMLGALDGEGVIFIKR